MDCREKKKKIKPEIRLLKEDRGWRTRRDKPNEMTDGRSKKIENTKMKLYYRHFTLSQHNALLFIKIFNVNIF